MYTLRTSTQQILWKRHVMNNGRAIIHSNGQSNVAPRYTLLENTLHQRIFNVIMQQIFYTEYTHGQDTQRHSGPRTEVNFQPSAPLSQRLPETTMTAQEQPTLKTHMVKVNKYNGKTSLNNGSHSLK
jgi:hypothetical protein